MKVNIGLKSNVEKDILKDLKDGDVLFSAYYDHGMGKTETQALIFRGYVDAPNNSKGVWGKYVEAAYYDEDKQEYAPIMKTRKKEDGTEETVEDIKVNDLSIGVFLTQFDALKAWKQVAKKIYESAEDAVKNYK